MRLLILLGTILLLFTACSKNKTAGNKTELLTAKPWKVVKDSISPGRTIGGQLVTDLYTKYFPCEKDDYLVFNTDGTFELNNGQLRCGNDMQFIKGTWFLTDGETKLNVSPETNAFGTPSELLELTDKKLTLTWYSRNADGSIARIHILYFTH